MTARVHVVTVAEEHAHPRRDQCATLCPARAAGDRQLLLLLLLPPPLPLPLLPITTPGESRASQAGATPRRKGDADLDNIASRHLMTAAGVRPAGQDVSWLAYASRTAQQCG
ncbi:hypothetical protein [Streptomyces cyslabdanicus]|uniref:hypothetical protein n=1 Tax=Streptomyces cyslabdanicus TaxID=1470456 RepID=UPI004043C49E